MKLKYIRGKRFTLAAFHPITGGMLCSSSEYWDSHKAAEGRYSRREVPHIKSVAKLAMRLYPHTFRKPVIKLWWR